MCACDNKPWRRNWFPAPHLSLTYLALALPGGSAIEKQLGAPAGTAHLLEHLLYAQNGLDGSPMDRFGGKFGLLTDRETITASLVFDASDAAPAWQVLRRWWDNPTITPDLLAREKAIVLDEIDRAFGGPMQQMRARALEQLAPQSHFACDFAGRDRRFLELDVESIFAFHEKLRKLGAAIAAVGPVRPWNEKEAEFYDTTWRPEPYHIPLPKPIRLRLAAAGMNRTIVSGVRLHGGLDSKSILGSYAAQGAIALGRLHPAQKRFHEQLKLRFLDPSLETLPSSSVFSVTASTSETHTEEVASLVQQLILNPELDSDPRRIGKVLRFAMARNLDRPDVHAKQLAIAELCGHPSPFTLYRMANNASDDNVVDWIKTAAVSSPAICTLSPLEVAPPSRSINRPVATAEHQ